MVTQMVISEEIPSGQETCAFIIPPEGPVYLYKFLAEAPISQSAVIKVLWKYDHVDENPVWSTKTSGKLTAREGERLFIGTQGVGETFKVALCFENADNKSFYMSGICDIEHGEI